MDQPKIERMLRLMWLLASNKNYTIDELGSTLHMSYRTVYRYIDTFKNSGFAVIKLYGNVYKLGKMPKSTPDFEKLLYFSEEEAYILNGLIDRLDQTNSIKAVLKKKLSAIYNSTNISEFVDNKTLSANLANLRKAINEKRVVKLIGYESSHSGTKRDRTIEPYGFTTNDIDVLAYDAQDLKNKVFKIARIEEVEILDSPWEFESSHRKQGMDIFRMSGHIAKRVKLRLNIRAKNLLREEYPLAGKYLQKEGNYWILDTDVYDYAGVCRFYVGLADEIKIIDSPEFAAYAKEYMARNIAKL